MCRKVQAMTEAAGKKKSPKAKPSASSAAAKPNTLEFVAVEGKSTNKVVAEVALSPMASSAFTASTFLRGSFGNLDLTASVEVLREKADKVKEGDLSGLEATLTAQAVALDAIFTELARRGAMNMGEYLSAAETYLRLALKAQSQCRATLETLANIKNPPVAYVRQANIAHGHQQVNNGVPAPSGARENENQQNKLLDGQHGEWMDGGAAGAAGGLDKAMATVGKVDRA